MNNSLSPIRSTSWYKSFLANLLLLIPGSSLLAASPIWLIENGAHSLYLAGTIHLLREQDYPLPKAFEQAYNKSQMLIFETDIGALGSPAVQQQIAVSSLLPDGQQLSQLVSQSTWQALSQHLQSQALDPERFQRLNPSAAALTLVFLELAQLGIDHTGVDTHFYLRATEAGKPTSYLESIDQHLGYLNRLGQDAPDEMLQQTLAELSQLRTLFGAMINAWRKGDRARIDNLFVKPMREDFPATYRSLLTHRNLNWVPQLEAMLESAKTEMVLVGSAHMAGADGLLELLRARGYKIRQLD